MITFKSRVNTIKMGQTTGGKSAIFPIIIVNDLILRKIAKTD